MEPGHDWEPAHLWSRVEAHLHRRYFWLVAGNLAPHKFPMVAHNVSWNAAVQ